MSGRQAVERWARRVRDRRRFHMSRRAADGKWVVWHKRPPPRNVAMEWVAVHVADTRGRASAHLQELVNAQHEDNPPGAAARGRPPAGSSGTERRASHRPADGDNQPRRSGGA